MLARTLVPAFAMVFCVSASAPDESYQAGGEWQITITPLQLPPGIKDAKGYTRMGCQAPLGLDSYPKVGRVKELAPGVLCTVTEVAPLGQPYRRVDLCRRQGEKSPTRITYVGQQSPERYSLDITTELPGRPDVTVVVREEGLRIGPCSKPAT